MKNGGNILKNKLIDYTVFYFQHVVLAYLVLVPVVFILSILTSLLNGIIFTYQEVTEGIIDQRRYNLRYLRKLKDKYE